uniref:Uncharacterized protein n=1 Tax=Pithovirus LCPAC404 TaxID=2506597 RepID=A0A481ZF96_9VIRU|nr:MAG: uncharacterized protein LCPAC404_02830 [Pithovirus LCPAC404]
MASIIFRAVMLVSVFIAILYFIFSIWIHNKQSNGEPISNTTIDVAFWFAIVLLVWFIGLLIWIFATFLLNKNVMKKAGDLGSALINQNESGVDMIMGSNEDVGMSSSIGSMKSPSFNDRVTRRTLKELEDL